MKKLWKAIGACLLALFVLQGCSLLLSSGSQPADSSPSESLSPEEMDRLKIMADGDRYTWAQLSDDEKLALADMLLKQYEAEGHVQFNVTAEDIVNWMEETNYAQTGTQNIATTINNFLFTEAIKEGKLGDILKSQ